MSSILLIYMCEVVNNFAAFRSNVTQKIIFSEKKWIYRSDQTIIFYLNARKLGRKSDNVLPTTNVYCSTLREMC